MSVHYKFKSNLDHDTVTFDGLNISIADLKKSIMQQKKIGKSSDFDLQITNAQTKEVYDNDEMLIPKNTSVIVARIPIQGGLKKNWDKPDLPLPIDDDDLGRIRYDRIAKSADLINANSSEEDKVKAMITQSSVEYDPSKYVKSRNMTGPLPPTYTCFRCGKTGHWIKNCPTNNPDVKRSTGIPRSFMVPVDGPEHKGALLTSSGDYAVPLIDHQAYKEVKKEKPPFVPQPEPVQEPEAQIPEELLCMFCKDLLQDAVLIPCCGNSFCDECIRQVLLESDDHECPVCNESSVSPDTLIPNRFLRTAVLNFKNETGYTRVKRAAFVKPSPIPERNVSPQPSPDSTFESNQAQTESIPQQSSIQEVTEKKDNEDTKQSIKKRDDEPIIEKSDNILSPVTKMNEDNIDNQPGTPLADEPVDDVENKTIETIGKEPYDTQQKSFEYSERSRYRHRDDYRRTDQTKEDSSGPSAISTIKTITNSRNIRNFPQRNEYQRPAPVRQQFGNRDDRGDTYSYDEDYHNYDKRTDRFDKRGDRNSQRSHHSHYDRSNRNFRFHQSGNARHYQDNDHSHHSSHYDSSLHSEESARKHQDRYRSPPHSVVIPPTVPPTVYVPPVVHAPPSVHPPPPTVPIVPPTVIPPPQVYPPQPPPPGASPIDTSHLSAQPPPPGVGPLLPTQITSESGLSFPSHSYDSEDPLKVSKKEERTIDDKLEAFQRELEKRGREHTRDRVSRSRSRSSGRHRSRSRSYSSKSWSHSPSRSFSRTPRSRSRTPFSSRSRSRSLSFSRSRSRSKIRSYSRSRSRTRTGSRSRSRSRIRRKARSRERVYSPKHHARSRSFSPKEYRSSAHKSIPFSGKSFPPPPYQGSYATQYAPPSNVLPLHVMRPPPAYPVHHIHPIPPVQPIHTRPVDHYPPIDRAPKYPSYNDSHPYPAYDTQTYTNKYQSQRYDREQRNYDKNPRYDRRQGYQRQEEEVTHRIPGFIGDRNRDYKSRNRSYRERETKQEIKELPKIKEHEEFHSDHYDNQSSRREDKKNTKTVKEKDEKTAKHKKHHHHHHHKSKESKKYESKESNADSVDKDSDSCSVKVEEALEKKVKAEDNEAVDSTKINKSSEKSKDKKHKHKKHKVTDQTGKKKRAIKKEKSDGAPTTDSDIPTKPKIKKKKIKTKQPLTETIETVATDTTVDEVSSTNTENNIINPVSKNIDSVAERSDIQFEELKTGSSEFLSAALEEEQIELELNASKEDIEEPENIEEVINTEEEEIEEEEEDVLRVDVPGLSKWERDSGPEETEEDNLKISLDDSFTVNKEESLPSEIIQKAEQVFLSHQMKPRIENKEESGDSKSSSTASSREPSPSKPKENMELKSVVKTEKVPSSELRVTVSREKRSVHSRRDDSDSRDGSQSGRSKQHESRSHSSRYHEEDRRGVKSHSFKSGDKSKVSRDRISDQRDRRHSPKREIQKDRNSSRDSKDYNRNKESEYRDNDSNRREERKYRFTEPKLQHISNVENTRGEEKSDRRRVYVETTLDSKSRKEKDIIIRSTDSTRRTIRYRKSRSKSLESVGSRSSDKRKNIQLKSETTERKRSYHREKDNTEVKSADSSYRRKHSPIKAPEKHVSSFVKSSRKDDFYDVKFEPDYDEFSEEEEHMSEPRERSKRRSMTPEVSRKRIKLERSDIDVGRRIERASATSSASSSAVSASESSDSEEVKSSKIKNSDSDYKAKHKKSRHKKHKKHKHKHKKKKSHKSKKD